jgi:hypothetical protein
LLTSPFASGRHGSGSVVDAVSTALAEAGGLTGALGATVDAIRGSCRNGCPEHPNAKSAPTVSAARIL